MHILITPDDDGGAHLSRLDASGVTIGSPWRVPAEELPAEVLSLEGEQPRWAWDTVHDFYPRLLAAGVRVARCHDISLIRTILRFSSRVHDPDYAEMATRISGSTEYPSPDAGPVEQVQDSLFDAPRRARDHELTRQEFAAQLKAIADSTSPVRLRLLVAAESAAALVATEMQFLGVPWDQAAHRRLLEDVLGPEPAIGQRPRKMESLVTEMRELLRSPSLNPDSPQDLLRALHRNGIEVRTTRQWELQEFNHPVIAPLLEYKKLSRLFTANGWSWLDSWVRHGRFRSDYVVGGVVTGRWSSRGGGALQIPKSVRNAVRALPGYKLLVADASQVEPRILAAMSGDQGMATAARGQDLYAEIADAGFGGSRSSAKVALLGAMYGATTGESARLMPQLKKLYPAAIGLVEDAARRGERGESVSTWLGRTTPPPGAAWDAAQRTQTQEEQRRADSWARSRGRFTRNFVVQGTAAEWAECWLAGIRSRLHELRAAVPEVQESDTGTAGSSSWPITGPAELVFFLHDEIMVHAPEELIPDCVEAVESAARDAGRLLFGTAPVDFPLTVAVVDSYDQAK
ncbi:bifunctional 3'-5' exonuclease/DNA polymerase [Arthrobacter sp. Y-9]|uniref:bifunctional 3'-5' exonuclease/DNA polymerase n=1 Tax=Arthrobacter sp. Y-9 TaxID=3039385 RepID=UPI00241E5706|nr:bifunctional 3'-5' exonuclease/DNA polymerase [Arthrobacter sp. Y-9]WFR83634.1 bifunctional 3'-5' exonuclease/DNA polymerase [Arthrobacter sp. Y-9]